MANRDQFVNIKENEVKFKNCHNFGKINHGIKLFFEKSPKDPKKNSDFYDRVRTEGNDRVGTEGNDNSSKGITQHQLRRSRDVEVFKNKSDRCEGDKTVRKQYSKDKQLTHHDF